MMLNHRWLPGVWGRYLGFPKNRYHDAVLRILSDAEFPEELACRGFHALTMHVVGFALQALEMPFSTKQELHAFARQHLVELDEQGLPYLRDHVRFHLDGKDTRSDFQYMLDLILEVGRNEHGLFYNNVNPQTGEPIGEGIADTWGYTYNGYYAVYELDGTERYREAVLQALDVLNDHYRSYNWENYGVDGYADAIESAINLYNREPLASTREWIDSETRVMWAFQDDHPGPRGTGWHGSAIIEGMHPDGNFARTSLMYALWKTQGLSVRSWHEDLIFGAVRKDDNLLHLVAVWIWHVPALFQATLDSKAVHVLQHLRDGQHLGA
jgi:hypothetical protein